MVGVAFQLDHAAVFDLGQQAAAPHAHLAHARDIPAVFGVQQSTRAGCLGHQGWDELPQHHCARGCAADFKEITAG